MLASFKKSRKISFSLAASSLRWNLQGRQGFGMANREQAAFEDIWPASSHRLRPKDTPCH
jgi:hypothetical protein